MGEWPKILDANPQTWDLSCSPLKCGTGNKPSLADWKIECPRPWECRELRIILACSLAENPPNPPHANLWRSKRGTYFLLGADLFSVKCSSKTIYQHPPSPTLPRRWTSFHWHEGEGWGNGLHLVSNLQHQCRQLGTIHFTLSKTVADTRSIFRLSATIRRGDCPAMKSTICGLSRLHATRLDMFSLTMIDDCNFGYYNGITYTNSVEILEKK
jgi:hypothetical protein